MSCCGGNCGCGSACKCTNCTGCKMYPDLSHTEAAAATMEPMVVGLAPQKAFFEESEMGGVGAEGGCKCGDNCTCNPCNCN